MYTKIAIFVFKFLFLALLQAKNELSLPASQRVFRRLKLMDFEKRVANKRMPAQKICSIQFFKLTFDSSQAK